LDVTSAVWKNIEKNLFGGFAGCKEFSALLLHLVHPPWTRGTAIETFADVPAQPFELQSV
jgi:hypothetical protein